MPNFFPEPQEPDAPQFTLWHNPTPHVVRVDLHVGNPAPNKSPKVRYTWQPGETKAVPSEFDHGIHHVHDGIVIGGAAPQLRRVDPTTKKPVETVIHQALDAEGHAAAEARRRAHEALLAKQAADQALVVAAGQAAQAEAAVAAKRAQADVPVPAPVPGLGAVGGTASPSAITDASFGPSAGETPPEPPAPKAARSQKPKPE